MDIIIEFDKYPRLIILWNQVLNWSEMLTNESLSGSTNSFNYNRDAKRAKCQYNWTWSHTMGAGR